MSGLSSPSSWLTLQTHQRSVNLLSIIKIGTGLAGFLAPAFCASTKTPFRYGSRGFGASTRSGPQGATASVSVGHNTTRPGDASELAIAVRLTAARDIILGLLMRDSTAAVVTRAVQADLITDILDIAAAGLGWIEGGLSKESALSVVGFAGSAAALSLYILNN
ncbi:hypothetical protein JCM3766R1_004893 [Sporobolomyces carnicolor]